MLPKAIREAAHLEGGTEVEVRISGNHLEIELVRADLDFIKKGDFVVAVLQRTPDQMLTTEVVENTRSEINRRIETPE